MPSAGRLSLCVSAGRARAAGGCSGQGGRQHLGEKTGRARSPRPAWLLRTSLSPWEATRGGYSTLSRCTQADWFSLGHLGAPRGWACAQHPPPPPVCGRQGPLDGDWGNHTVFTRVPHGRPSYLLGLIRGAPPVVSGRQACYCPVVRMESGAVRRPDPPEPSGLAEKRLRPVCGARPGHLLLLPCSVGTAGRRDRVRACA